MLTDPRGKSELAVRLRSPQGLSIGETFAFLSGLYFRGKIAYAHAFGDPLVITTDRGLVSPDTILHPGDLLDFARVDIATAGERHAAPLRRDAQRLDDTLPPDERVILLGSIATGKYTATLLDIFGERLLFPLEFVGRGDMSRGGLLLRCVHEKRELQYVPVAGAVVHGVRPPRLDPRTRPVR